MEPGGQLTTTTEVDNFPGLSRRSGWAHHDGRTAKTSRAFWYRRYESGTSIQGGISPKRLEGSIKPLWTMEPRFMPKAIVSSARARQPNIWALPSEQKLRGGGVSACAVCDGFFYKGQEVAIVGGGDTAAEEATYLANICSKVTMLVRKDKMRASKAMQHRVTNTPNIDLKYNHEIDEVLGDQVVEGLRIFNNKTGEKEEINITGLFIAIGHQPNTEIFNGQLDMDDEGYLITKGKSTKTNIPGVFASGDVQDKEYRQAVTAAGTGCMAALDAERYLQTL